MDSSKGKPSSEATNDQEKVLTQAEIDIYQKLYENGDMSTLKTIVEEDINKWKKVPVNIAVTGNSGVGKSSFINSFRDIRANGKGAAEVGVDETTTIPKKYVHPVNKNLALWDLPGLGTQKFPKSTYLQDVKFDKYDFFLIITATRFTENDLWLAKEVEKRKKKFFLIRTKMNIDVQNARYDNPKSSQVDTVNGVREAMKKHVEKGGLNNVEVFLIDNHFPLDYDYPDFLDKMIDEVPEMKQEAITLTMTHLTGKVIKRKEALLRQRIYKVAICSAVGGAVPLPGLGIAVDAVLIRKEIDFYKKQLGLDGDSLKEIADSINKTTDELLADISIDSNRSLLKTSAQFLIPFLTARSSGTRFVSVVSALSIFGSVVAAGLSYRSTVNIILSFRRVGLFCIRNEHLIYETANKRSEVKTLKSEND